MLLSYCCHHGIMVRAVAACVRAVVCCVLDYIQSSIVHRDNMMHMYDGPVPGFAVRAVIHYLIVSNKTENDYYDILGIPRASL